MSSYFVYNLKPMQYSLSFIFAMYKSVTWLSDCLYLLGSIQDMISANQKGVTKSQEEPWKPSPATEGWLTPPTSCPLPSALCKQPAPTKTQARAPSRAIYCFHLPRAPLPTPSHIITPVGLHHTPLGADAGLSLPAALGLSCFWMV